MRQQTQEDKRKKYNQRHPPSVVNVCSMCGFKLTRKEFIKGKGHDCKNPQGEKYRGDEKNG